MGRVILVTGANGFIGRRLLKRLAGGPWPIVACGRGPSPAGSFVEGLRYVQADLSRPEGFKALEAAGPFDTIAHLAGAANFRDGLKERREMLEGNVTATFHLLEMAKDWGSRFLFASSGMVYGDQPGPFREDMEAKPVNFYALSKLMAEDMIRSYSLRYGIAHLVFRTSIVYGPGQPPVMFIPSVVEALSAGREFPMTEGRQVRDFLYVDDCVQALALGLFGNSRGTYNLATGVASTLAQVAAMAGEVTGAGDKVRPGAIPYRENELWEYYMDIGRICGELGWRPVTALKDGIRKVAEHGKNQIE